MSFINTIGRASYSFQLLKQKKISRWFKSLINVSTIFSFWLMWTFLFMLNQFVFQNSYLLISPLSFLVRQQIIVCCYFWIQIYSTFKWSQPWPQEKLEQSQIQKWICKYLNEANHSFTNLRDYGHKISLFPILKMQVVQVIVLDMHFISRAFTSRSFY